MALFDARLSAALYVSRAKPLAALALAAEDRWKRELELLDRPEPVDVLARDPVIGMGAPGSRLNHAWAQHIAARDAALAAIFGTQKDHP